MLTRAWRKIDRFYLILALVVLVLSAPLIFTARGIFGAFITAFEIDTSVGNELRIDKARLDEAVISVYDKDIPKLDLKEAFIGQNNTETNEE